MIRDPGSGKILSWILFLLQVCLRVRVPGRAGETGAVAADGQVLPHAHPGAGVPARRLALRTRRHRQDRVRQGPRLPAGQVKHFRLNFLINHFHSVPISGSGSTGSTCFGPPLVRGMDPDPSIIEQK